MNAQAQHQPPVSDPEAAARDARHEVYADIQAGSMFTRFDPLRRVVTFERDVRSWPLFALAVLIAGGAYWFLGRGYWDFRDPTTGTTDWVLVSVYWVVCASFVWLIWPLPSRKTEGSAR